MVITSNESIGATKTTQTLANGTVVEMDAINSVKIIQDAKGGWRVSEVKVYDSDPDRAAELAVRTAEYAQRQLAKSILNMTPEEISRAVAKSANGKTAA